jgi:hypothetical protein
MISAGIVCAPVRSLTGIAILTKLCTCEKWIEDVGGEYGRSVEDKGLRSKGEFGDWGDGRLLRCRRG